MSIALTERGNMTLNLIKSVHDYPDKGGIPYYLHPIRVAGYLPDWAKNDEDIFLAALLHDVVEDTSLSLDDLRVMGYSPKTQVIVLWVTKSESYEFYDEWIDEIIRGGNKEAMLVKWADLQDNMDPTRPHKISDSQKTKYEKAFNKLTLALGM